MLWGQQNQREKMIISVSSKTPHCKGNESQYIVALLENVLMSIERETRLQEEKGFMKSTDMKSGTDRECCNLGMHPYLSSLLSICLSQIFPL
jgi:hypothetical protein